MPDSVEYNLYTRFHFKNQPAMGQMKATGGAFQGLYKSAKLAQSGVRQIGTGLRQVGMFGVGAIAVIGGVVKRGMEFGKAWADAKSVLRGLPKDIDKLREHAKHLGATTLYTATQAAEGMEHLARSSLSATEVAKAIRPVLKLSVADNIDLAGSAKIVASAMKLFKDQITDITQVTDAFAYTSRNSMTNTTELGEAFKYAGPAARLAKQDFFELTGTLGLLAQANIRGTLAGTAYKNAVTKLAKGGKTANKIFGGKQAFLNAVTDKKTGKWKSFADIMRLTMQRLAKTKNEAERAGLAFKLFGLRGITTFSAFSEAGADDFARLITNIKKDSIGTADAMAKIKQQSLHGQWLLFKSALDGVALSLFDIIKPSVISAVKMFSGTLQDLSAAFKGMSEGMSETKAASKWGTVIAGIAFGIKESFVEVGKTLKSVGKTIFGIMAKVSGATKGSAKRITKLVTKFILFAAAITPVIGAVAVLGMALGGMFNIAIGGMKVLTALTSTWGIAFLAITYAFSGGQKKGESFIVTMTRGLKSMISLADKLLWPFKKLAEHLGTIPALMAGIATYKVGKGMLARAGGALSRSRNPLARAVGGVTGAATGQPVFVTNWPIGAGMGGGLGGAGAGAAGAAGKAGFFSRIARFGGMTGLGTAGMFTGGSVVSTSTGATAGAAGMAGAVGTAAMALGAFTAALAPAVAGVYAMGKAYDPSSQAALRKKLVKSAAEDKKGTLHEIIQAAAKNSGVQLGPKWTSLEDSKNETWDQKYARQRREKYGVTKEGSAGLRSAFQKARSGDTWGASSITAKFGADKIATLYNKASEYDLAQLGLTKDMITVLRGISAASSGTIEALSKGYVTKVYLDGKEIAIATATHRNESKERAGRIPKAGARRRAMTRGTD